MNASNIDLQIEVVGIASVLSQWKLDVPLNQRPYAWQDDPVETILHDLTKAFDKSQIYLLGSIVLSTAGKGARQVSDGQQRLATISLFIAAIRDYLIELGDTDGAVLYQSRYLIEYDPRTKEHAAKLRLNTQDDTFFFHNFLLPPADGKQIQPTKYASNERLQSAAVKVCEHVRNITVSLPKSEKAKRLYDWIDFLKDSAVVIAITVPASVSSSFRMFETLNDRGIKASQVDILKNYLFDQASKSPEQIHTHWMSMMSTIESQGGDELILTFIRHLWISMHGPITEPELGGKIEEQITSERQALDFVAKLDTAALDYVALLAPAQSSRWNEFSTHVRKTIDIITNDLSGQQIRPLMLAVMRHFEPKEAAKVFTSLLSWTVRFLIVGGAGGGRLERYYGLRAKEITDGKIKTKAALLKSMEDILPRDKQFEEEFAIATVKRANLARYYLRAIESYRAKDTHPQLLINEDPNAVNLEHVLPVSPSKAWKIDTETAETFYKRMGNMVLLGSKDNVAIGNDTFKEKRLVLKKSPFSITREVGDCDKWGADEIRERQRQLAVDAVKVWAL